jgi:hypothetical protein
MRVGKRWAINRMKIKSQYTSMYLYCSGPGVELLLRMVIVTYNGANFLAQKMRSKDPETCVIEA